MGFKDFLEDLAPAVPLIGGGISALMGLEGRSKDKRAAQDQMDFQERMSGSAYQRAMLDMKKAGLNPMLAYSQGGASTPSGASPPQAANIGSAGLAGVNSALNLQSSMAANKLAIAQSKNDLLIEKAHGPARAYGDAMGKSITKTAAAHSAKAYGAVSEPVKSVITKAAKWSAKKMIPLKKARWDLPKVREATPYRAPVRFYPVRKPKK